MLSRDYLYVGQSDSIVICRTWEDLAAEFANEVAYAGGLGKLMNYDFEVRFPLVHHSFHDSIEGIRDGADCAFLTDLPLDDVIKLQVWLCMKNHPCLTALETKGKKVPLHVRMPASTSISQGWSSSTAEECVFPFTYGGEAYYSCVNDAGVGPWCATTGNYDLDSSRTTCSIPSDVWSNTFPSCKSSGYSQCVFPFVYQSKTHHSCIPSDSSSWCSSTSNYDLDGHWEWCTCSAANVYGAVHQIYEDYGGSFAAMGITGSSADGRLDEACLGAATIEFSARDMLTGSAISEVSFEIYKDGPTSDYLGCDLTGSCGTLVTPSWDYTITKAAVTAETWYLIIIRR